jgi:hypothetical protein
MSESAIRHKARSRGLAIRKDRARSWSLNHQGGYQVLNESWYVVAGERYELTLGDVERIVASA